MLLFIYFVTLLAFFVRYYFVSRRIWDVVDTPTVSPSGAIVGLCEVKGQALTAQTPTGENLPVLTSPIGGFPCVWYHVLVEWYNTNGKNASWDKYKEMYSQGGFRIGDEYGSILANPAKMNSYFETPISENMQPETILKAYNFFVQFPSGKDALVYSLWRTSPDGQYMWHPNINQWIPTRYVSPDRLHYFDWVQRKWFEIAPKSRNFLEDLINIAGDKWSNSKLRVTERIVVPNSEIFAHGYVKITDDGSDLIIGPKNSNMNSGYISSKGEKEVFTKLKNSKIITLILIFAFALLVSVSGIFYNLNSGTFFDVTNKTPFQLGVFLLVLAGFFGCGIVLLKFLRTYNRFVKLREQVRLSRSAIDVTTKRRASLIPELCEAVEGAMSHEAQVMESITRIRNEEAGLAAKEILALGEAFPNLKTVQNFLQLQKELGRTEEKITMARSFYNDSLLAMNNLRATLSGIVLSPLFAKEPPLKL